MPETFFGELQTIVQTQILSGSADSAVAVLGTEEEFEVFRNDSVVGNDGTGNRIFGVVVVLGVEFFGDFFVDLEVGEPRTVLGPNLFEGPLNGLNFEGEGTLHLAFSLSLSVDDDFFGQGLVAPEVFVEGVFDYVG